MNRGNRIFIDKLVILVAPGPSPRSFDTADEQLAGRAQRHRSEVHEITDRAQRRIVEQWKKEYDDIYGPDVTHEL